VFFGMVGVTFFGIFLTPVFYVVIRRVLEGRPKPTAVATGHSPSVSATTVLLAVVGASSALWFSGCAAGPDYRRPATTVAPAFANGAQTNFVPSPAAVTWWRGFQDAQLNRLIERALNTNQDLRIATARVREARALRSTVALDAFPTVTTHGSWTKGVSSLDAAPELDREQREYALYNGGFDAAWELDLFGRVRRSLEASTAEVAGFEAARRGVLISLLSEVARNYLELRGLQHELAVARQNISNQQDNLEITEARLKAGRSTELDAARARSLVSSTRALVPPLEAAIKQNIHRLSVLLGLPPATLNSELATPAPIPTLPALVNIGNPGDLLRRRPDIQAAERALAAATARLGVQTADLFPRVTFNGQIAFEATDLARLGASGSDTYSFGPRITWAALDLGRVRARIKAAHAEADVQLATYEKTVLTALEETENALVSFGQNLVRRDYLVASAQAAAQAVRLATTRYEGGISDFLPVLDAQRTQLSVQEQLAQTETRAATALVAIYKALGGGWEIEVQSSAQAVPATATTTHPR